MYTPRARRCLAGALAVVAAVALAACSKAGSTTTSDPAANAAPVPQAVTANIEKYSGPSTFTAPGGAIDISSLKGKKVFDIPSVPNPFVQSISAAMQDAATKAGMVYTRFDNQAQVSQWVQGINQAIASKQDIIVLNGAPDPRALQPQLQAAKAAGIPVVVMHFHDNDMPEPPACEGWRRRHRDGDGAVQRGGQGGRRLDHQGLRQQGQRADRRRRRTSCRAPARSRRCRTSSRRTARAAPRPSPTSRWPTGTPRPRASCSRPCRPTRSDQLRLCALRRDGRGRRARGADPRQDRPGEDHQLQRVAVRAGRASGSRRAASSR